MRILANFWLMRIFPRTKSRIRREPSVYNHLHSIRCIFTHFFINTKPYLSYTVCDIPIEIHNTVQKIWYTQKGAFNYWRRCFYQLLMCLHVHSCRKSNKIQTSDYDPERVRELISNWLLILFKIEIYSKIDKTSWM